MGVNAMATVLSLLVFPAQAAAVRAAPKLAALASLERGQLRCLVVGHEFEEHADDTFNRWCTCARCGKFVSLG